MCVVIFALSIFLKTIFDVIGLIRHLKASDDAATISSDKCGKCNN